MRGTGISVVVVASDEHQHHKFSIDKTFGSIHEQTIYTNKKINLYIIYLTYHK
jgi:hypothetical protein